MIGLFGSRDVAERAVGQVVLRRDPELLVNSSSHRKARDQAVALEGMLRAVGSRDGHDPVGRVVEAPGDPSRFAAAVADLRVSLAGNSRDLRTVEDLVAQVEARSLCSYWHGRRAVPLALDAGPAEATASGIATYLDRKAGGRRTELAVVVPARVRSAERRRNLTATVGALADQDVDRGRYSITVVEQDTEPRVPASVVRMVDGYRFVENAGDFNKAWAFNLGVADSAPTRLLCLLDADSLVERGFVHHLLTMFGSGRAAFLPYSELLFMDEASTRRSIRIRFSPGADRALEPETLRGAVLSSVKGFCLCVTRDLFGSCGGFDERFRGWGDEDNDFHDQLSRIAPVEREPGLMVHLAHPRPHMINDQGLRPNSHLVGTPRAPGEDDAQPDKYRNEARPPGAPSRPTE